MIGNPTNIRGVYKNEDTPPYKAAIVDAYGITHLGEYDTKEEASDRYESYIRELNLRHLIEGKV